MWIMCVVNQFLTDFKKEGLDEEFDGIFFSLCYFITGRHDFQDYYCWRLSCGPIIWIWNDVTR